ncbi:hypothetical protein M409DRAFT_54122 [Zasmidium cellare ATCC 36951]|uniref:Uncharacterized protein n=1 Tax=Zasmidium cellare ATCC 36951 TaxID=1080233 RepID=A0A6A6CJX5_ZASCE|nr:uncharacterized protein M409DRAFT_54122 [Zasmidium cellare ATCC 36951]KAF2167524.1 hypothetical protein M409DRAFT_54122 [Zasmidium cellare ATCC 36951]
MFDSPNGRGPCLHIQTQTSTEPAHNGPWQLGNRAQARDAASRRTPQSTTSFRPSEVRDQNASIRTGGDGQLTNDRQSKGGVAIMAQANWIYSLQSIGDVFSSIDELCQNCAWLPKELCRINQALPHFYHAISTCWLNAPEEPSTWVVLMRIEACARSLHETMRQAVSSGASRPSDRGVFSTFAEARRLLVQMHESLLSLPPAGTPESVPSNGTARSQTTSIGEATSAQNGKYLVHGSGTQYNSINEGSGRQTVTNYSTTKMRQGRGGRRGATA